MALDITMPRLSDSMEEGVVVKWHVEVGASVERGQLLAEIDTDKATMEYEADAAGTILEILVHEGESALIGTPIARLGAPGEIATPTPATLDAPAVTASAPRKPKREALARSGGRRANASPIARRLAAELGVDLNLIQGSGPGDVITKEDVQRMAAASGPKKAPVAKGDVRREELTRVQQTVARRMAQGAAVPVFAVEVEVDMSMVVAARGSLGAEEGDAPSLNDYIVKAAALALREFPRLNGSYTEQGFELYSRVNVGIAVAAEDSLIVPTIFDADEKTLSQIAIESRRLADGVRRGTITPAELDGGTFTVTNLGMFGVRSFLPIINPPQAGILAVGAVSKRPVVHEDARIVAREMMTATLVCDHRIAYGADGARFLARVRELLEQPDGLIR